jgi:hypothetical protein
MFIYWLTENNMPTTEDFKVKLVSAVDQRSSGPETYAQKVVVFTVSPQITESGTVGYEAIQITQGPISFQSYTGTPARTFGMSDIKLISRTPTEARENIETLNMLRAWRMPYFGQTGIGVTEIARYFKQVQTEGSVKLSPFIRLNRGGNSLQNRLGAPPEILYFSAYSQSNSQPLKIGATESTQIAYRGNIHRVPVVITNLGITYPNDVAYIPTAKLGETDALGGVPFPTIMTVSLDLVETHSPGEMNRFNLAKYVSGVLDGF